MILPSNVSVTKTLLLTVIAFFALIGYPKNVKGFFSSDEKSESFSDVTEPVRIKITEPKGADAAVWKLLQTKDAANFLNDDRLSMPTPDETKGI